MLVVAAPGGAGRTCKVLDFGLASRFPARRQIVGTPAYMAPEILLGDRASVASDLYAVAMVAAEMLLGRHPFAGERRGEEALIAEILSRLPELGGIGHPGVAAVLGRALDKVPSRRQRDAQALLSELAEVAGEAAATQEPAEVRDSFLMAAPFTGREAELGRLLGALNRARLGQGSGWLLLGESGVGKSRVMEELRSLALVNSVTVARGQAVQAGGGAYQLFREALRLLCLQSELSELETSVLATLLPGPGQGQDLGALLGREVLPPPELEAPAAQARLLRVLTELILRQSQPVLLLLDDLQWADAESLVLLRQLSRGLASRRLLIVASARVFEAPRLPGELPELTALPLRRLDSRRLERLCESMLGPPGRDAGLLELIGRETEGNTFFVVEVLRTLAEESGSLDEIIRRSLPGRVLTGGMQQLLSRRLSRVPEAARPLLRLAAVAGRQLELEVLGQALEAEPERVEELLQACTEVGVLEVQDASWRFSHDKLREGLLAELDGESLRGLHGRLAAALLQSCAQDPLRAVAVAHHYREAGQPVAAAEAFARAGETALRRGSLFEALELLESAAKLHAAVPVPVPVIERARVWRGITLARSGLGRQGDVDAALRQVFALAGQPLPEGRRSLRLEVVRRTGRLVRKIFGRPREAAESGQTPGSLEAERERLACLAELGEATVAGEVYLWLGPPEMMALCALPVVELGLVQGAAPQRLRLLIASAYLLSLTPLRGLSRLLLGTAEQKLPASTRRHERYLSAQAMVRLERGEWHAALPWAEAAIERCRAQGDELGLQRRLVELMYIHFHSGDTGEILRLAGEILRRAEDTQAGYFATFARAGQGLVQLWRGELAQAQASLSQAHAYASQNQMPHCELAAGGLLAACWSELGEQAQAQRQVAATLGRLRKVPLTTGIVSFGLGGVIEALLREGERAGRLPEGLPEGLIEALGMLGRVARRVPVAAAGLERARGRAAWLAGKRSQAVRHLERSWELAASLNLRRDEALARYFLSRYGDTTQADAHLRAARALFTHIGANLA